MYSGASCIGSDENCRAEGRHEVETGNGGAGKTNERWHGEPCESGDKGKALAIVEDVVGGDCFPGYETFANIWKKVYT